MIDYFHPTIGYLSADDPFTLKDVQYPAGWLRTATGEQRASLEFEAVTHGERPDDRWYWVTENRNGPSITYAGMAKDIAVVKAQKLADLAAKRWTVQTGGATVAGSAIKTDPESLTLINGAASLLAALVAASTVNPTVQFKGASGAYSTLTHDQVQGLAIAVGQHVQASFSNEAAHVAAIDALTDAAAVIAYDFSAGWPENPVQP